MSNNIVIKVENLSKRYRVGKEIEQNDSFISALTSFFKSPFRNFIELKSLTNFNDDSESKDIKWALKDVSFEIKEGSVVGVIGTNGSGKSTLLKLLSRITSPTEGIIQFSGRVASLLEVGTGFHQELTGKENIYLNGSILGMRKEEIDKKIDKIINFSGISDYINTPVKRYSSGMKVRLAFSVAAHLDPDILLIDEVLAVGDADFQKKCLEKMDGIAKKGRTILFVSHNLDAVTNLCNESLWINDGKLMEFGLTPKIIESYLNFGAKDSGSARLDIIDEKNQFILQNIELFNSNKVVTNNFKSNQDIFIKINFKIIEKLKNMRVGFILTSITGIKIFDSYDSDQFGLDNVREEGFHSSVCKIPKKLLFPLKYYISINVGIPGTRKLCYLENVLTLNVENIGAVGTSFGRTDIGRRVGLITPLLHWEKSGDV